MLKSFTSMTICNGYLTLLPYNFGELTLLTSLMLSGHFLFTIPPFLTTLPNLTYLDLSLNKISDIQPLSSLTSMFPLFLLFTPEELGELIVGENEIRECKPVSTLTSLQSISFKSNPIGVIQSGSFSKLRNLHSLSLKDTKLRGMPMYTIEELSHATKLNLSENALHYLPDCWHNYKNIVTLNLEVFPPLPFRLTLA